MMQPSPFLQNRSRSYIRSILLCSTIVACGISIAACGSIPKLLVSPAGIVILTQPTNQLSSVGQTASFTVLASGTAPLTYQWSVNGTTIPGATSTNYSTPILVAADDGSIFTVTVSNLVDSIASSSATLTVGPRAPQVGDLRFQQVGSVSTASGLSVNGVQSNVSGSESEGFADSVGTPLAIGAVCSAAGNPLNCTWPFRSFPLPTGILGLTTSYQSSEIFGNLGTDLDALSVPDVVITSFDLEPGNSAYAISSIQTSQASGFSFTRQSALPGQIQTVASQLGAQSQVITAISFDSCGDVDFLAYAWQNDNTTIFEVKVMPATLDGVGAAAMSLGAGGYIITALGGDTTNGFLLVGTRVQGDTMPRPILVVVPTTDADLIPLFQSGDAVVGYLINSAGSGSTTWIGEH
jgi:hypothetical protein